MEQKEYKLEIVNELLKGENHVRAIAKKLYVNHMIVVRKLKELLEENVVDFKLIGKNKRYFLKKTIEAKSYVYRSENYKLIKLLKKYPNLRRNIEKIQQEGKINIAILFGSYAKFSSGKSSDIDLYIETKDNELKKKLEQLDSKLSIKIGKFDLNTILVKEIIKNHVILKGVEIYYERIKFFK